MFLRLPPGIVNSYKTRVVNYISIFKIYGVPLIGYKFFYKNNVTWRDNQGGVFLLSSPLLLTAFSARDAVEILNEFSGFFLRWESEFDSTQKSEWWHVIKDDNPAIESLSSSTRSKIRRGLKKYECSVVSREYILKEGYEVYKNAFSRYSTHEKLFDMRRFKNAIINLPEKTEFWGVMDKKDGALVAYSENYVDEKCCFYNTIWFAPSSLKKYSSYAVFYKMNKYYLEEVGLDYISDGARSLSHSTNIHDYLISKFGFRKAYSKLNVCYRPWLKVIVSLCYPFRSLISAVPVSVFRKVSIILKQEEIRRNCIVRTANET